MEALIKTLIHLHSEPLEALIKVKFWPDLVAKTIMRVQPTARGPNLHIDPLEVIVEIFPITVNHTVTAPGEGLVIVYVQKLLVLCFPAGGRAQIQILNTNSRHRILWPLCHETENGVDVTYKCELKLQRFFWS